MGGLMAREVMTRPVVSALSNASARDIALQMLSGAYSGMPVTDGNGEVIGVISELDLLGQVCGGTEPVRLTAADVMSRDPVTEKGHLVGIIACSDILRTYREPEFAICR
ncbi:MAG: CBS domain-containing protein [Alphaproteobacteria bacterium]|uniref:CBS domain-containing protein n=1 Tax=Candidatus Nitrobium versatile TaxID=2884831 RepID=A0A953JBG7_9BACT|nr:CBS domain-containing protein [Candidatus Nitrobium versatile]